MKILVDADELNKAFDIVANASHHVTPYDPLWIVEQLQKACNILGPMWSDGVSAADKSNPVESDGFKRDIDWCESRLQDHDGVLIEILDMLIENENGLRYLEGPDTAMSTLHKRAANLKAKLVGDR